jgi:fructose-1,6-bisphosphatase/inositol monophosphatase family enzyme
MNLTDSDLTKLRELAMTAATQAGAHIQAKVGQHRESNTKEAGNTLASQVVTEVDLESQTLILEMLHDSIDKFQLGLLTEESEDDSSRFNTDFFWCIDPLDGTLPFIEGTPGYSVSIALVSRSGEAVIGVIHDPVAGDIFHAQKGQEGRKNRDPLPPPNPTSTGALTWIMDRSMKSLPNAPEIFDAMEEIAEESGCSGLITIDQAGAALNGAWVTQHSPAVYYKFPKASAGGGSVWDFAASSCLMEEWGQPATDIFGEPLDLNPTGSTFMNERGVMYASDDGVRKAVNKLNRLWASK